MPREFKTKEICLEAVKRYGLSLGLVTKEKRTLEIQRAALEQNGIALGYIKFNLGGYSTANIQSDAFSWSEVRVGSSVKGFRIVRSEK
jgi:hypothetical protein